MTRMPSLPVFESFPVEVRRAALRYARLRAGVVEGTDVPGLTRMKEGSEGSETSESSENSENSERSEFSEGSEFGERSTPSSYATGSRRVPQGEWGPLASPVRRD